MSDIAVTNTLCPDTYDFEKGLLHEMKPLRLYALRLTKIAHKADDLLQETMMRALRARESFQAGTNMRAWLTTIMKNQFLSQVRRKQLELGGDEAFWLKVEFEHTIPAAMIPERIDIERAMERMPPEKLGIILKADVFGQAYDDIAEENGVPVGTVKSRLFRSREYMRELLGTGYMTAPEAGVTLPPPLRRTPKVLGAPRVPLNVEVELSEMWEPMTEATPETDTAESNLDFMRQMVSRMIESRMVTETPEGQLVLMSRLMKVLLA